MNFFGIDLNSLSQDEKSFLISFFASLGVEVVKSLGTFTRKKVIGKVKSVYDSLLNKDKKSLSEKLIKELEKEEVKERIGEILFEKLESFIDEKLEDNGNIKEHLEDLNKFLKEEFERYFIKGEGNIYINVEIKNNELDNHSQINNSININR